jgi:hypothetical protein
MRHEMMPTLAAFVRPYVALTLPLLCPRVAPTLPSCFPALASSVKHVMDAVGPPKTDLLLLLLPHGLRQGYCTI